MLRLYCDLSRLHMERPWGASVYARQVLDALLGTGEVVLVSGEKLGEADVVLNLDGRFRVGRGQRVVTAIADLGHLYARRAYGPVAWMSQNWRTASAARRSDHLLAPSPAVASGLETYLRVAPSRITVFPPVPSSEFRRPPRAEVEELRGRLGLPARYFLFVGARSGRKNLRLLGSAFRMAAGLEEVGLVLAGPGSESLPEARDLGYVPTAQLPGVIAGALAWVNPSHYEGSALGALEAMGCGTPVIATATGAQARVIGMSGMLVAPDDAGELALALGQMAGDRNLRGRLSAAGTRRVEEVRASAPLPSALLEALSPRSRRG